MFNNQMRTSFDIKKNRPSMLKTAIIQNQMELEVMKAMTIKNKLI